MFKKARILLTVGILMVSMAAASMALEKVKAGVVDASSLNMRAGATTQSEILKKLPNNMDLTVFSEEGDFYKVSAAGSVGFVSKEYVVLKDVMNVSDGGGAKITASALNIRSKPGLDADVLGKIPEGETASIIGINNGWLKVNYGGITGYISPEYVGYVPLSGKNTAAAAKPVASSNIGQQVVDKARQYMGVRYVYGGSSPSGFDCSGLTSYVYKSFGVSLNRSSGGQTSNGTKVSKGDLQPGDLVFFNSPGSGSVCHVGIYSGNGNFIHAVKPGRAVETDTLWSGYYDTYFWGARRIL